jgi:DNA replication protein DnaC
VATQRGSGVAPSDGGGSRFGSPPSKKLIRPALRQIAPPGAELLCAVRFANAISVINDLAAAQKRGLLKRQLKTYLHPEMLVLDEIGYLPIDQHGADLIFQVISQRYERGSIVLTTNKPFKQWPSIFNNDSTIASAVLDRLLHHAQTIVIEGSSYRMKDRENQ